MENNDSNLKPQQTGGLKLMTVFIAVLALHVVVIGGLTAYHLMSGGSADADLVTDKAHKGVKVSPDGTVSVDSQQLSDPDASQPDKSATASTTPADASTAPAPEATAPTEISSTPSAPVATSTPPATTVASSPAPAPEPPAPVQTGPVITPSEVTVPTNAMATGAMTTSAIQSESLIGTPYVVKRNDTLVRIAHRTHTSVAKLKAANGLNGEILHLGQKLLIPAKTEIASVSAPAPTADASDSTTLLDNSTPAATPTTVATTPRVSMLTHHTYTVVKGDTLIRIAHRFKTTASALMTANNISDPTKLGIGKKLVIPSREARSATTAAPASSQPSQTRPGTTAQLANFVQ